MIGPRLTLKSYWSAKVAERFTHVASRPMTFKLQGGNDPETAPG